jgi:sodium pump decarboxylase gamma subunit
MILIGMKLTILGMGVVTCFLLLLILIMNISYKLLAGQTAKELAKNKAADLGKRKTSVSGKGENVLAAVISAAVAAHRSRRR